MTDIERRLAEFEKRLQLLEDERDVARVLAAYGPLVDSGRAETVAALWEPDGVYDVDELFMAGREQISAMVRSPQHQEWIKGGCAHVVGPPHVRVDGDGAQAVCYSLLVVHSGGQFVLRRATANHWRLRRSERGWQVTARTSRVLDGRAGAPELLGTIEGSHA